VRVPSGNKACLFLESLHRDAIHPSIALILLLPLLACSISYAHGDPTINVGEAIYRDGILGSGKPLKAIRNANMRIEGKDTACVNCHRRSGFGSKEGRISIPPITGLYLFHQRARRAEDQDLPFVESMRTDHDPYSDETLARAIREGLN
jgi:cytochrome c553